MYDSIIEYNSVIDAIIDAYEGDDTWAYEDEVIRTVIDDCDNDNDEENR